MQKILVSLSFWTNGVPVFIQDNSKKPSTKLVFILIPAKNKKKETRIVAAVLYHSLTVLVI